MRKYNAVLTLLILVLFLVHAVLGSFQLIGIGNTVGKAAARAAMALIAAHTVIGIKYTADTLRVWRKTGVSYVRENRLFWARRISGFAVMLLLLFHLTAFGVSGGGIYRLKWFDTAKLTTQLLLVAAIALHVMTNVKPMLISFGCQRARQFLGDILVILSVLLLFMAAAFIVYYLRWNMI